MNAPTADHIPPPPRRGWFTPARLSLIVLGILAIAALLLIKFDPRNRRLPPYNRALTQQFMQQLGLEYRFAIDKEKYLATLQSQQPEVTADQLKLIDADLTYREFLWALAPRVEMYFSPADLTRLIEFHSQGVGKKKLLKTRELLERLQRGEQSEENISPEADRFYDELSAAERKELAAFDESALGRRLPEQLALIYEWFDQAFETATGDALTKMQIRAEKPPDAQSLKINEPVYQPRNSPPGMFEAPIFRQKETPLGKDPAFVTEKKESESR